MQIRECLISAVVCAAAVIGLEAYAQQPTYTTLLAESRQSLAAGDVATALVKADTAIKIAPERWEAYALGTAALAAMNECDAASQYVMEAYRLAPSTKRSGVRDLLKDCLRLKDNGPAQVAAGSVTAPAPSQAEIVLWKSIETSTSAADFEAYLKQYPHGIYSSLAQARIDAIRAAQQKEEENVRARNEQNAWNSISNSNNPEDFRAYLSQYPNGLYSAHAKERIAELEENRRRAQDARNRAVAEKRARAMSLAFTTWKGAWCVSCTNRLKIGRGEQAVLLTFDPPSSCYGTIAGHKIDQCTWDQNSSSVNFTIHVSHGGHLFTGCDGEFHGSVDLSPASGNDADTIRPVRSIRGSMVFCGDAGETALNRVGE